MGYIHSDHGGDTNYRQSTSGSVFFLGGNLVNWASQKQKIVAMSCCDAEYVVAASATTQDVWLSRLLGDL